jgi:hypothetical protein
MSQSASQHENHPRSPSPACDDRERSRRDVARRKGNHDAAREGFSRISGISIPEFPRGAIRVNASGIVVEHRPPEASDFSAQTRSIVGQPITSIAPWASEPAFLAALQSAIDSTRLSFHLDFKTSTKPVERVIHVNLLAVGDKTVWMFISDKTLALIS